MLKQRIITAAVLIPLVVWGILKLPAIALDVVVGLVYVLAAWEWTRLSGFEKILHRVGILILILFVGMMFNASLVFLIGGSYPNVYWISLVALGFILLYWLWVTLQIILYPRGKSFLSNRWLNVLLGVFTLGPAFLAMDLGVNYARVALLYIMVVVWSADIGAYFAGKKFGKHKLAPQVSPGKSWEGVIGGLLAAFAVIVFAYFVLPNKSQNPDQLKSIMIWIGTGLIAAIFSIVGDLFISLLKRNRDLKDTGALLPGHGGVLDRIDGLIAAIAIYAVLVILQGA
jgi:phosphatidate cytidylyltransferase